MQKILSFIIGAVVLAGGFIGGAFIYKQPQEKIFGGSAVSNVSFGDYTISKTMMVNTSTSVLNNNNGRIYASLGNNTTSTIIYLNLGTASTTADDYTVAIPAGGRYEIKTENLYTGAIYASSSAASSLLVFEK